MKWLKKINEFSSVKQMRDELLSYYPKLASQNLKNIIIVGAADEGIRLSKLCEKYKIQVEAHCDDNKRRHTQPNIQPTEYLKDLDKSIPVILATHRVLKATDRLKNTGFETVAPFAVLQVLEPTMFSPFMFYEGWFEALFEKKNHLNELAQVLEDDFSREVLDSILGFRLTLNPSLLRSVIDWELYMPRNLFKYENFKSDVVYVDAGAFDGDSARLFISRVKNKFSRVIAFEPDQNTFSNLKKNFESENRVDVVNKGLYSETKTLHFDHAGTRGSIITEKINSGTKIEVTNLDEFLNGASVSLIKMNIEGAEIEALKGCKNTIKQCKPILAISAYHRPTDLWEIPFLIKQLNHSYKLYLRQHDGGVIETVLYGLT